jgi:hypothetical protein
MEQFKGSMNNSNDQEPKDTKMMTDEMKHEFRNMTENMDNSMDGEIFCSICKSVTEFDRDSPRLIGWLFLLLPPSERIKSGSVSCECANF